MGKGGGGEGEGGGIHKNKKRLETFDFNPLFRDLEDNQIEELPPGVFENNTELVVL